MKLRDLLDRIGEPAEKWIGSVDSPKNFNQIGSIALSKIGSDQFFWSDPTDLIQLCRLWGLIIIIFVSAIKIQQCCTQGQFYIHFCNKKNFEYKKIFWLEKKKKKKFFVHFLANFKKIDNFGNLKIF